MEALDTEGRKKVKVETEEGEEEADGDWKE